MVVAIAREVPVPDQKEKKKNQGGVGGSKAILMAWRWKELHFPLADEPGGGLARYNIPPMTAT